MRCVQCGNSNPETNKFCGMCGLRLEPVSIDEHDPLELEAPEYELEHQSKLASERSAQIKEQDRHRELVRDLSRTSPPNGHGMASAGAAATDFPPTTVEEEAGDVVRRREPPPSGIAGPSFLGLGYES